MNMSPLARIMSMLIICLAASCVSAIDVGKVPQSIWTRLARGESQVLIVEFESIASKTVAVDKLFAKNVEILKDYEALPLVYLRFHAPSALKDLLGNPTVVNVYENQHEKLLPAK